MTRSSHGLNKLKGVKSINTLTLGTQGSPESCLDSYISNDIEVVVIALTELDYKDSTKVTQTIRDYKTAGLKVILKEVKSKNRYGYKKLFGDYDFYKEEAIKFAKILIDNDVQGIINLNYEDCILDRIHDIEILKLRLLEINNIGQGYFLFRNASTGLFTTNQDTLLDLIQELDLKLSIDVGTGFLTSYSLNDVLVDTLKSLMSNIRHYELSDNRGLMIEYLELNKGKIDFKNLKKVLNPEALISFNITTQGNDMLPIIRSYEYLKNV